MSVARLSPICTSKYPTNPANPAQTLVYQKPPFPAPPAPFLSLSPEPPSLHEQSKTLASRPQMCYLRCVTSEVSAYILTGHVTYNVVLTLRLTRPCPGPPLKTACELCLLIQLSLRTRAGGRFSRMCHWQRGSWHVSSLPPFPSFSLSPSLSRSRSRSLALSLTHSLSLSFTHSLSTKSSPACSAGLLSTTRFTSYLHAPTHTHTHTPLSCHVHRAHRSAISRRRPR